MQKTASGKWATALSLVLTMWQMKAAESQKISFGADALHWRGFTQEGEENKTIALRLHYRRPNELVECVLDTLIGVAFLVHEGQDNVALVGHSFGGAVVISAA